MEKAWKIGRNDWERQQNVRLHESVEDFVQVKVRVGELKGSEEIQRVWIWGIGE